MDPLLADFTQYETLHFKQQTAQQLVDIGALFGDDEALMRAKAECLCEMLHRLIQEVPAAEYTAHLPDTLAPGQVELVKTAIQEGALRGIHLVLTHALKCISDSKYDLCTSKLAARPNA